MDRMTTSHQLGLGSNLPMKKTIVFEDNGYIRDELMIPFESPAENTLNIHTPKTLDIPE